MSLSDCEKKLEQLIAKRDAMFRHLARRYADLDYAAVRREEFAIEEVARKIAATRAAITRAKGSRVA